MPPWFADPRYGTFREERRLSDEEIRTIADWVSEGAREGDAADLPARPTYASGWTLGDPDLVLEPDRDFAIPADGIVEYQHFRVPTNLTEERWLQSVEILPGDRERVHHAVIFYTWPNARRARHAVRADQLEILEKAGLGPVLASYGPGIGPKTYPTGSAKRLRAGTTLVFQMHYQTTGTPGRDRTRVGLIFAKNPPAHEIHTQVIGADGFVIPAGTPDFVIQAKAEFLQTVRLWSLLPHGHLRLRSMDTTLRGPEGRSETVLSVPNFSFDWQTDYTFVQPVSVLKGSTLEVVAHFDNSSRNPRNPNPAADVPWGIQTWEEMMNLIVDYSVADDSSSVSIK